jgi:hypothetical protein
MEIKSDKKRYRNATSYLKLMSKRRGKKRKEER